MPHPHGISRNEVATHRETTSASSLQSYSMVQNHHEELSCKSSFSYLIHSSYFSQCICFTIVFPFTSWPPEMRVIGLTIELSCIPVILIGDSHICIVKIIPLDPHFLWIIILEPVKLKDCGCDESSAVHMTNRYRSRQRFLIDSIALSTFSSSSACFFRLMTYMVVRSSTGAMTL